MHQRAAESVPLALRDQVTQFDETLAEAGREVTGL